MNTTEYLFVALFVAFAFIPVTMNALRKRRDAPPMAANDRKLYRLWQSDPEAYQRQYGAMDTAWLSAQEEKAKLAKARSEGEVK